MGIAHAGECGRRTAKRRRRDLRPGWVRRATRLLERTWRAARAVDRIRDRHVFLQDDRRVREPVAGFQRVPGRRRDAGDVSGEPDAPIRHKCAYQFRIAQPIRDAVLVDPFGRIRRSPQDGWAVVAARPTRRYACLLLGRRGRSRRQASSGTTLVNAELSPDGQVVGDPQRLFGADIELTDHVEHFGAAGEFFGAATIENEIVVRFGAAGVGGNAGNGPGDAGQLAQLAEFVFAGV